MTLCIQDITTALANPLQAAAADEDDLQLEEELQRLLQEEDGVATAGTPAQVNKMPLVTIEEEEKEQLLPQAKTNETKPEPKKAIAL